MYTLITAYLMLNAFLLGRLWDDELPSQKESGHNWLDYHVRFALLTLTLLCFLSLIHAASIAMAAIQSISISKTHIKIGRKTAVIFGGGWTAKDGDFIPIDEIKKKKRIFEVFRVGKVVILKMR